MSFKTGPAALWRELLERFTAASTRAEVQRVNNFLADITPITNLDDVPKFLAQAFAAADSLKLSGSEFPCSTLATIMLKRLPDGFEKLDEDLRSSDGPLSINKLSRMFFGRYDILKALPARLVAPTQPPSLTAFAAQTVPRCPNCQARTLSPLSQPKTPFGQFIFEYWRASHIQPTEERRRGYDHCISIGYPPN